MKFKNPDSTSKDMLMTEAPSWEQLSTVSELVETLMAWQTLDHIIHPALSTLRHKCDSLDCKKGKYRILIILILTCNVLAALPVSCQASLQEPGEDAGDPD